MPENFCKDLFADSLLFVNILLDAGCGTFLSSKKPVYLVSFTFKPVWKMRKMYIKIELENQVNDLVVLAGIIWGDCFKAMFDNKTLSEIIKCEQSKAAILQQIENGFEYYFITRDY